jgi:glutaryl-CoA dehydrogenase
MATGITPRMSADYYLFDELLSDEERVWRDKAHDFCAREMIPIARESWDRAEFPAEWIAKLGASGLAGGSIQGYGCPGMSAVAAGLVAQPIARRFADMEAVYTYEGADTAQSLIVGREITGLQAFSR